MWTENEGNRCARERAFNVKITPADSIKIILNTYLMTAKDINAHPCFARRVRSTLWNSH